MKKLFLVIPVALLAVFMATSCRHEKGSTSSWEINEIQLKAYDDFIDDLKMQVWGVYDAGIPEDKVKQYVEEFNSIAGARLLGIIIEDTQAGQSIARGTSKEDLKKRFKPKKV